MPSLTSTLQLSVFYQHDPLWLVHVTDLRVTKSSGQFSSLFPDHSVAFFTAPSLPCSDFYHQSRPLYRAPDLRVKLPSWCLHLDVLLTSQARYGEKRTLLPLSLSLPTHTHTPPHHHPTHSPIQAIRSPVHSTSKICLTCHPLWMPPLGNPPSTLILASEVV